MAKYAIQTHPKNCTGCLRCRLACSFLYSKSFKPSDARLQIVTSDKDWSIIFFDDCTLCGVCSDNCFFDALIKSEKEAAV